MDILELLKKELTFEAGALRRTLERVPFEKAEWKPHAKSMTIKALSIHLAELPAWITLGLNTSELDFAAEPYKPAAVSSTAELVALLDTSFNSGLASLEKASEADLLPSWTMRHGDHIISVLTKYEVIRHALNQITHHRAQLGVYLRLLDIPVPGVYGPSADEQ